MATRFIQLDEAAEMLGISPEELNEKRSRNEIRGFRDGTTWKFKADEVEKFAESLKASGEGASGGSDIGLGEEDLALDEGGDSVLLSERELGGSDLTSPSTIIGDTTDDDSGDSDISLADDGESVKPDSGIELVGDSMIKGSDVKLAEGSNVLGDDASKSDTDEVVSDLGLNLDEDDLGSLELSMEEDADETTAEEPAASDSEADSGLSLAGDSDLALGPDDSLTLGDSGPDLTGGSTIDLSSEDDDLVLGGSGSDVTVGSGDSGISLMDPADSGLSLTEETLELGGSAIGEESLVLGEDDMITLGDDPADHSAATQLKSDDDFLLTPLEDAGGDESESGSQVIALDDSVGFDQSAATMLQGEGDVAMLEEDLSDAETMVGGPGMQPGMGGAVVAGAVQAGPATLMAPAIPEAPYSIWNVLALFACIMVLSLGGMLIYDVVRQVWSWEGAYPATSGMMDWLAGFFAK